MRNYHFGKSKRRMISMLLVVVMLFSTLPVGAIGGDEALTGSLTINPGAENLPFSSIEISGLEGGNQVFSTLPIHLEGIPIGTDLSIRIEPLEGYRIAEEAIIITIEGAENSFLIIEGAENSFLIMPALFDKIEEEPPIEEPIEEEPEELEAEIPLEKEEADESEAPVEDVEEEQDLEDPEEVPEEPEDLSIIPMGIGTLGVYTSDENSIVVPTQLTGTSINDHTIPVIVWANGETVYAAVKSTHKLESMTLGGKTSTDADIYAALVSKKVDGENYEPSGLQGSGKDNFWTVFKFHLSDLAVATDGILSFFVKGTGGGHNVGGEMTVTVPKIEIIGNKEWLGVEQSSIELELKRYPVTSPASSAESVPNSRKIVDGNTTPAWTYTWSEMQEYSSYGQKYIYYVDEVNVPLNYEKTIDVNGGRTVINTYKGIPSITVDKTATITTFTQAGDKITYNFVITNSGNTTLEGPFSLEDNKIGSIIIPSSEPTTLAPGETITVTGVEYTVSQADMDAGFVTNIVTATVGNLTATDTVTVNGTKTPALTLTKEADKETYSAVGEVITYTYGVTNSGNISLAGPFLISDDNLDEDQVVQVEGPLAPGASGTATGTRTVTQADLDAGSITNIATASFEDTTSNEETVTVDADKSAALTLVKTADESTYSAVGEVITYTYKVTNSGNITLAGPFVISDNNLDAGQTVQVAGPLAPGASGTATGTRTVTQADLDAGSITNIATASFEDTTSNEETVTVDADKSAALTLVKTADESTYSAVGEVITYTYKVTNSGNITLAGPFVISDNNLDAGQTVQVAGPLAPGASGTATGTRTVTQADLDAGSITNIATASFEDTTSNEETVTVDADKSAALTLVKTADESTYSAVGEVITYTYKVTNSGNITLAGPFVISDNNLDAGQTVQVAGPLAPGASGTATGTRTVTQADLDAGSITNIATASFEDTTSNEEKVTVNADKSAAITLVKTADKSTYSAVGEKITYTYKVTNSGNITLAGPFVISDDNLDEGQVVQVAGPLAPGAIGTATGIRTVKQTDLDAGSIVNKATATFGNTRSNEATETVTTNALPALTLVKTANKETYSAVGEEITYTYEVTNSGNITLEGPFLISDDNLDEDQIVEVAGPLAPGASGTATGIRTVKQTDLDAGSITNIATASFEDTTSNDATVTVNAVKSPVGKLTVKKVLENEPQNSSFSLYGNNDPIAFGFKVTGPYGYEETFTLIAGQSITLDNLYYGNYTVEETQAHGYTVSYDPGQNVSITKSAKEATVTVTNSNTGGDATTVSKTITKVWENGPKPGATLELWRKGQALDGAAIDEKVGEFAATATELTETYSGLAKHDPSGREFEYYVKEDTVPENYTASINQETLTVTNTYTIPTEDVIATKVWDENIPEGVTKPGIEFELWRKGGTAGEGQKVVDATALTDKKVDFGKQDKTDINGVVYEYFVKEIFENPGDVLNENWIVKEEGLKVTNTVNEPEGKLTIKKVITPKSAETSRKFKVRITGPYGYEKVIEIASGKSVELKELYYGKYTVTEINPDGFEPQYSAREVILRKNNPKAEITITNKKIEDPTYPIWPIWPVDPTTPELNKRDHFGYVIGYPQGDFRPENTITRAEMTAIFARLLEEKIFLNKDYPIPFDDVSRNAWYAEYVGMLTQVGVISGYPDGSFRPENPVTRAEFATVASRFIASKKTVFGGFTDIASEYWAKESIQAAYAEGWLKGYPDGSFRPERELTRAEAVTIINRMLDRIADKDYVDANVRTIVSYTDLSKAYWAYYDIMEASNSHDYERLTNRLERWTRHWRPY